MTYEFEGKTEKEAIDKAVSELGLNVEQFDVEILELQKGGFFKKGFVKIRVHIDDELFGNDTSKTKKLKSQNLQKDMSKVIEPITESDLKTVKSFLEKTIELMGYKADVLIIKNTSKDLQLQISAEKAPSIIGKHGKTLDALQLFTNVYLSKIGYPYIRAYVDCENYRRNKEESIIRKAYETADRVTSTKHSVLLEPMSPYERRIVHTTLSDLTCIETKSEGNGLYKQVRVLYKK